MTQRRTNLWWGLIPFGVSVLLLLNAFDTIPPGLFDLAQRAWPALLIAAGLILLLKERVPFGGLLAILLSAGLVGGVAFAAYSSREDQARTENQVALRQNIGDEATLLVINVTLQDSDLTVRRTTTGQTRQVSGEFLGSDNSEIITTYSDSNAVTVEYTVQEQDAADFPMLTAVGRGALTLDVPADMPIAVNVIVKDGLVTLNLSDTQLERLTLTLNKGDALVTLPSYQPLSLNPEERPGDLNILSGDLTLFVPNAVDARVMFNRRGSNIPVVYDAAYIDQRAGQDGLLRREVESSDIRLFFDVAIPSGELNLQVISE